MTTTERLRELERAATAGPWVWSTFEFRPQLEGKVEGPEFNPVLVCHGCGNKEETTLGVRGCMSEGTSDPLRACALHPTKHDRDLIAATRNALPAMLAVIEAAEEIMRLVNCDHHEPVEMARCRFDDLDSALAAFREVRE